MFNEMLVTLYHRDLTKLKEELNAYTNEENIWKVQEGISNSTGNLTLHLIGNLNHFIGAILGQTGYIRQRDNEFAFKNVPRHEMIRSIDDTIVVIQDTLNNLVEEDFDRSYPLKVVPGDSSTRYMLMHLIAHLSYHLGQINYHRRLLSK